jgi:putative ABC transport system permease protein
MHLIWLQWIWQDLRYGLRGLRNQPGFTILAVVALALGIGAATTIFSVIQNVLLDPFPYTDARRIVAFYIHDLKSSREGGRSAFKVADFLEYQQQNHVFSDVIGGGNEDVLYTSGEGTERFDGAYVPPNTFRFLGVPAITDPAVTGGKPAAGAGGRGGGLPAGLRRNQGTGGVYSGWRIPREAVIGLNVPVLLFSVGTTVFTALLFGLVPALQTAQPDLAEPLKDSGRGVSGGFRQGRLRSLLVVVEVALSLVLLAGAGLMMRTFVALQQVDIGLNPDNILVARLPLPRGQYDTAEQKQRFFHTLLGRLQNLPGVVAVTETCSLPPYGGIRSDIEIPGRTHAGKLSEKWTALFQLTSEGYFPTLGIRLQRGRALSEVDVNEARKLAVVNQTLATKFFGKEDPIGNRIKLSMLETLPNSPVKDPVFEIVGVVADAKNQGLQDPTLPELFIPYTVTGGFERGILVRTANDPLPMLNAVRREIWAVDRHVAVTLTGSLQGYLKSFSYAEPRFSLILLGVFAAVGLVLVALGVYSVIAYTVSRQTHEIGIRMALGAGRPHLLGMVFRMGLRLLVAGVAVGLLASFAVTRLIASQLWGVTAHDPLTLAGVVAVVAITGLAACYFPARRATRVDPMVALRYE